MSDFDITFDAVVDADVDVETDVEADVETDVEANVEAGFGGLRSGPEDSLGVATWVSEKKYYTFFTIKQIKLSQQAQKFS